jgi:dipicolinate synthase subunit A
MDKYTIIMVTDKRQQYISDFLPGRCDVLYWEDEKSEEECLSRIRMASRIVLPTPAAKLAKTPGMEEMLKYNLINCKYLFGGKLGENWIRWCEKQKISYLDFMEDEEVAWKNAGITAEATAAEILKHAKYSVRDQKIVVTGYGKCGKSVADLLGAMGAKVTVLARSAAARRAAKADGHNAADFSYGAEEAYGAYVFVNTVPACVLTENIISEMHPDSVIVDIASAPGGCDKKAAEKYGIPIITALGLPGIYTPKSSAKVLADAICKKTFPDFGRKEEKSWIFQIII